MPTNPDGRTSKIGDTFIFPIIVNDDVAALLYQHCKWQREDSEHELIPSSNRILKSITKYWNPAENIRYAVQYDCWRPLVGGLSFTLNPQLDIKNTKGTSTKRAVALLKNSGDYIKLMTLSAERNQGGLVIQEVNGDWYVHCRYSDAGTVKRTRFRKKRRDFKSEAWWAEHLAQSKQRVKEAKPFQGQRVANRMSIKGKGSSPTRSHTSD